MKNMTFKVINFAFERLLSRIHRIKPPPAPLLCRLENMAASVRGKRVRFSYDKDTNCFIATEGYKKRFFSNFERGTWLYGNGIDERAQFIFMSYCLQNLSFSSHDVVIDCGANSGDLTLKLFEICENIRYIGIEPSPDDYEILTKNVKNENAYLLQKALGDRNDKLKFYICSEKGDSSLIEPSSYTSTVDVEVLTLESLVKTLNLEKVKLIKIEAEGFEPEILKGAQGILGKVEYIAVDGGYERGIKNEQTMTTSTNFLINNGFEMVDIYFPWCRALFRNKSFN